MNSSHSAQGQTVCDCRPTHDCVSPMVQTFDAVVRNGLAFATAALRSCTPCTTCAPGGPCNRGSGDSAKPAAKRTVRSRPVRTARTDNQRRLTLDASLSTGYLSIPGERITLQPSAGRDEQRRPLGILRPNEPTFFLEVDATGVPGAVYEATVRVRSDDGSPDETVKVFVEL